MMPVAGNIQSARKNCLSENYPFRKDDDESDKEESEHLSTEYDDKFTYRKYNNKPTLKRDFLREQFRKKATQAIMKQAKEQYETIHRQEVERMPLKKRPDYYLSKVVENEPQYNMYNTDDMTTFWSYRSRANASRRKNTNFTKPISEQLDQQFG